MTRTDQHCQGNQPNLACLPACLTPRLLLYHLLGSALLRQRNIKGVSILTRYLPRSAQTRAIAAVHPDREWKKQIPKQTRRFSFWGQDPATWVAACVCAA